MYDSGSLSQPAHLILTHNVITFIFFESINLIWRQGKNLSTIQSILCDEREKTFHWQKFNYSSKYIYVHIEFLVERKWARFFLLMDGVVCSKLKFILWVNENIEICKIDYFFLGSCYFVKFVQWLKFCLICFIQSFCKWWRLIGLDGYVLVR